MKKSFIDEKVRVDRERLEELDGFMGWMSRKAALVTHG